jgi:hypothetical protein
VLKELQEAEKNETAQSQPGCLLVLTGPESLGTARRGCGKSSPDPPPISALSRRNHFLSLYLSFSLALTREFKFAFTCLGKNTYNAGPEENVKCAEIGQLVSLQPALLGQEQILGWGNILMDS